MQQNMSKDGTEEKINPPENCTEKITGKTIIYKTFNIK